MIDGKSVRVREISFQKWTYNSDDRPSVPGVLLCWNVLRADRHSSPDFVYLIQPWKRFRIKQGVQLPAKVLHRIKYNFRVFYSNALKGLQLQLLFVRLKGQRHLFYHHFH